MAKLDVKRRSVFLQAQLAGLLILACQFTAIAATDEILFVRLKWSTNGVAVVRTEIRPGRLKAPPSSEGRLELHLADGAGRSLWSCLLDDPRLRRYEVPGEGPGASPSRLESRQDEGEVEVRIPHRLGAREIQLWGEIPPPRKVQSGAAAAGEGSAIPHRPLLMRHRLPETVSRP